MEKNKAVAPKKRAETRTQLLRGFDGVYSK